jgi:molybdopterin converting factor subunit 1
MHAALRFGAATLIVNLQLFAVAKERVGRPSVALELPEPATVAQLRRALGEAYPVLRGLLPNLMIAVNSEYADDEHSIPSGAEVAAIPPVSGGAIGPEHGSRVDR